MSSAWIRAAATAVFLVALYLIWGGTLTIGPQTARPPVHAPPGEKDPRWIERLGMTNLAAKGDPTALFDAAREQATDPDALTRDMCAGRDMDADLRFREIRAALVRNNEALCGGFWGRRALASPASIELGMIPGVIVNLALTVLLFVALGWVWLRVAGLGRSRPNKKVLRGDQVAPKHAGGR